jgi:hypothetical protein
VGADGADVVEPGDVGPVVGEDFSSPGVRLDLGEATESCALEAEIGTADT